MLKALMLALLLVGLSRPLSAELFVSQQIKIEQNTVCERKVLNNLVEESKTNIQKAYVMTQMALQFGTCIRLGELTLMDATVVSAPLYDADGYEMYIVRVEEPIAGYTLAWPHLNVR